LAGNESETEENDAAVAPSAIEAARSADDDDDDADDVYDTPLHHAAHQGRTKCLQQLLDAGAKVNARDAAGNRYSHIIARARALSLPLSPFCSHT
jgi:ankyrin repeat protein